MEFKQFLAEETKNLSDINKTLKKLPNEHRKLLKGFKFKFQGDNTIKNDDKHVGIIDTEKKTVTISAPYFYPREWVMLHELGHLVWKLFVNKALRKKWSNIVKNTKNKMKDGEEELFCMAYAGTYAKHKIEIHNHPEWESFVKALSE
jgi:Zn-dependent peptidase ImmA (M78 family)